MAGLDDGLRGMAMSLAGTSSRFSNIWLLFDDATRQVGEALLEWLTLADFVAIPLKPLSDPIGVNELRTQGVNESSCVIALLARESLMSPAFAQTLDAVVVISPTILPIVLEEGALPLPFIGLEFVAPQSAEPQPLSMSGTVDSKRVELIARFLSQGTIEHSEELLSNV